ncbi:MAG: diguanylate cyclase [Candidatus Brocadiaceae bacterium]|nr:diguanylate cyclase [Candidatus Brocadiaceae bacterium]
MKNVFTSKMTLKYSIALGIIAILSIASYFTLNKVISSQETSAAVINATNKQRFLSQNVAIYSLCIVNTQNITQREALRQEFLQTIDAIEQAHKGLVYGDQSMNLPGKLSPQVHTMYFDQPLNLDAQIHHYLAEARALANEPLTELNPSNTHLLFILSDFTSDLVDSLNLVINQLQKESEEKNKKLQVLELSVLGTTLLTLLIIAFYLFRPMAKKIKQESLKLLRSEAHTRLIIDNAMEGIITFSQEDTIHSFNPAAVKIFGYQPHEIIDKPVSALITKTSYRKLSDYIKKTVKTDDNSTSHLIAFEVEGKCKDGTIFPVELSLSKFHQEGNLVYLMTVRDITEQKNVKQRLKIQYEVTKVLAASKTVEETTKKILHSLCDTLGWDAGLFWQLDNKTNVLFCKESWGELSETIISDTLFPKHITLSPVPEEGIPGTVYSSKKPTWIPDILSEPDCRYNVIIKKCGFHAVFAFPVICSEEMMGIFELYSHKIQQTDEKILNVMNTLGNHIGQFFMRKHSEEQLEHLATHDTLTNLYNRRRFEEELEIWLANSRRYGAYGALLFIDLDNFKYVNDTFGHKTGDELLVHISSVLKKRLRESDVLGRLGGDEFAAILSHMDKNQAISVAKQMVETVHHHGMFTNGHNTDVTASIGIALYPDHSTIADFLISCADQAMYHAKEKGRNGYCIFSGKINHNT